MEEEEPISNWAMNCFIGLFGLGIVIAGLGAIDLQYGSTSSIFVSSIIIPWWATLIAGLILGEIFFLIYSGVMEKKNRSFFENAENKLIGFILGLLTIISLEGLFVLEQAIQRWAGIENNFMVAVWGFVIIASTIVYFWINHQQTIMEYLKEIGYSIIDARQSGKMATSLADMYASKKQRLKKRRK